MSTGPQPEPATHLLLGRPILQQVTAHLQAWRPQIDGRRFVVRFEASPDAGEDWRQRMDASAVSARGWPPPGPSARRAGVLVSGPLECTSARKADSGTHGGGAGKILKKIQAWLSILRQGVRRR